jgi:predicted metal-binding membrane protein
MAIRQAVQLLALAGATLAGCVQHTVTERSASLGVSPQASPAQAAPQRRAPLSILVSLIVVTGIAWALTVICMSAPMGSTAEHGAMVVEGMRDMAISGISAADWSLAGLAVFMTVWTVMMVAMMLPSAAPMILIFAAAQARRNRRVAVPTWIFFGGYIFIWGEAGVFVYALVHACTDLVSRLDWLDHGIWAPIAFGVTLIVAGLYEFTPLKRLCLRHCRAPSAFVAQHWQDGWAGALDMGMQHGLYCVGCCWALFAVLVVAGMMSIALMLLLALVIFAENVLPHGPRTSATVAVVLIALGLLAASGAVQLPWHA